MRRPPCALVPSLAVLLLSTVLTTSACDDGGAEPTCGDGTCDPGETPPACPADCPAVCGDGLCTAPDETVENCPDDCVLSCALTTDLSPNLATGALFYGYPALGRDAGAPSCASFPGGREVYLGFTPDFTGELVISTRHPSTNVDTILELRADTCDGAPVACAAPGNGGSELTVSVQALSAYVVVVETTGGEGDVFALQLRRPGVCDGLGTVTEATGRLLTGERFPVDTVGGPGTLAGSCGGSGASEARVTFVAPVTGEWLVTTAHPDTAFDTLLHLREGSADGSGHCAFAEAEIGCDDGDAPHAPASWLRFEAVEDLRYDLFVDGTDGAAGLATLTLGLAADSPALARLDGCDHETLADRFALFVPAGAEVRVAVDTVDLQTAADTRLRVRLPDGAELHVADDDVPCTFPPPQWSCPSTAFTAGVGGLYTLEVYVGSSEACADRTRVNYQLTATVNGAAAEMILFGDQ